MGSPHLDLFRAMDLAAVLFWATPSDPTADPVPVEANAAADRLGASVQDERLLAAVRQTRDLDIPTTVSELVGLGGVLLDARVHRLDGGWIGAVLTPSVIDLTGIDELTGLGNRDRFLQTLRGAIDAMVAGPRVVEAEPIAALLIDIDRLQEVNDTLGHDQGDVLLRQTAARLRKLDWPLADPCRLGSDEFGLVARLDGRRPEQLGAEVTSMFAAPFALGRLTIRATVSVGVAVAPDHGLDAHAILRSADVALSVAKETRSVAVYRSDADRFNMRRLQMLAALRDAIIDGDLALHYQPKIDLATGRVAGAEALVRWHDDALGDISPDEFVPLAEDRGLIGPLSEWVLGESGRQCREWADQGLDVSLSANISARNLYDPGLVRWLSKLFDEGGLAPGQLTLELTETQVAEDLPMARQILRRLQAIGAKLSIDDFGTGYSSLSYLSKLPLDELKIDRSFVLDLDAGEQGTAMVQTIISLAHDLSLRVVAEGVESEASIATLQSMGCDQVQGFHVSRPLCANDYEDWLATGPFAAA